MKTLIFAILLIPTLALAGGTFEKDASKTTPIQGFAPNGSLSQILTVNSTTIDMSNTLY